MSQFIEVILPLPLEKAFTYKVGDEEAAALEPGMRVAVPFGKSKHYTALVYRLNAPAPSAYEAKAIDQLLDESPVVTRQQIRHWEWIARYYMCSLGEVFRAAIPSALLLESETLVEPAWEDGLDESELGDDEFLVFEALHHQEVLKVEDISAIVDRKNIFSLLQSLLSKGVIRTREHFKEVYSPRMVSYLRLTPAYAQEEQYQALFEELSRAPQQRLALLTFFQLFGQLRKPVSLSDLERESGVSRPVIRSLVKKGFLEEFEVQEDRVQFEADDTLEEKELNEQQGEALEKIREHFKEDKVSLLHGITSSGKTEVYVKLIDDVLGKGKQVLYLLPEIALTTQLIERLSRHFGNRIVVFHSRYSMQERVEAWNRVLRSESPLLVIGARSALFMPFSNLGLVVVDEEHETTFKQQDPAPRYHARDAAIVLANLHQGNVLLGSATPSIESYHNAMCGKYGYASMDRRYGDVLLPEMELVDLKEHYRKKRMKGHFTERLFLEMEAALKEKEQVILFQNRRGFAPIVECQSCGHSKQCSNCDVSLTYHRHLKQLRCHYCGYHEGLPLTCPACGNPTLDTKGLGTEQIEAEVKEMFPEARVARMDLDTTRGKHGFSKIISSFEQGEIDVLVGTQMVTKGLDFRNVGLVGIMNADTLLNYPDFRAHERSFQLLTQVAGRAGRTAKRGRVLIQTYNPYHQILQQVTTGDYKGMYREQIYEREQFKYPPAIRIIRITFKHRNYEQLNEAAAWFAQALRQQFRSGVLGPEFPPVARVRNQYIKHVLLKIPQGQKLAATKNSIKRIEGSFNAISKYRVVRVIYNVDYF